VIGQFLESYVLQPYATAIVEWPLELVKIKSMRQSDSRILQKLQSWFI